MKIITISGTRPDWIRLIPTIKALDRYLQNDHTVVWISQNFDNCLSRQFFEEFDRQPDLIIPNMDHKVGLKYISHVLPNLENCLATKKPDAVLVLGDTNASFCATLVAKKLGIKVFHMEAGNRCFDPDRVPEEINRYMIDAVADWHLCYTDRSREHLLLEGKRPDRIVVVGNPIAELVNLCKKPRAFTAPYYLVTLHRKENINDSKRLFSILEKLNELGHKVRISNHPSLKSKLKGELIPTGNLEFFEPVNFSDFVKLQKEATCVITDSGTVPEECSILGTPSVLLRFSTERPELLENNSMVVCSDPNELRLAVKMAVCENKPIPIKEYHNHVSSNVVKLLMRCKNG